MKLIHWFLSVLIAISGYAQSLPLPDVHAKWPSPTPWLKDRFTDFLEEMPRNAVAAEVGVQGGGFAAFMLKKTNPKKLYLIDCWEHQDPTVYDDPEANVAAHEQEKLYHEVRRRFRGDARVEIIRKYSKQAALQFADESLDWVYIDANHGYEAIKEDLALWWPKVKKGGVLSGHDYIVRPSFGVVQAVNEFLRDHGLYFTHMTRENEDVPEAQYDSWAVKKPLYPANYKIVFIHLGEQLPSFLETAMNQARLFNPNAEILLVAQQGALDKKPFCLAKFRVIPAESLKQTPEHTLFTRLSTLNRDFRAGFWFYATERLFYLNDLISQYDLHNVFHLENDNMLYCNFEELLDVFQRHYRGIAAPFEQDFRGAASCIFVRDQTSINALASYLQKHCRSGANEMELLSRFKDEFGKEYIDHLPVITEEYGRDHSPLRNPRGTQDRLPAHCYAHHSDEFGSLFDACSYGQYFGGIDPRNGSDGPGYINPLCIFNCSHMSFAWETDSLGRKVPYAVYGGQKFRLNNLHIHSKNLQPFYSGR